MLPDPDQGVGVVDLRGKFFRGNEWQVILYIVEILQLFFFFELRILNGNDVSKREWLVGHKIKIVLCLFIQFLDCLVGIHVSRCLNTNNVGGLCKYFVTNWVLKLIDRIGILGASPMHFY